MTFSILVVVTVGLVFQTATALIPPILPEKFVGKFTEYYAPLAGPPPYLNGVPRPPFKATRGLMYYDWSLQYMIEVRMDYCINIFSFGNDFPCTFHNVNGTSYLITFGKTPDLPPCCVFGQPWYPPNPYFLRENVTADFAGKDEWDCRESNWWTIPQIAPPTGPFWYAFHSNISEHTPQVYQSFSVPGVEGWIAQNFFDVQHTAPPDSIWKLPAECLPVESLKNCGFF